MGRILGLDLGTNSIGWAVVEGDINENGQVEKYHSILDSGVRIFPEGLEPDSIGKGEKEKSRNAGRREFRQKRRQAYRKRMRKAKLLDLLVQNNMCPLTRDELKKWNHWDPETKSRGRKFPDSPEFIQWLSLNPYELRQRALKEDISREELGRILYHMIQRRGFVSSRKEKEKEKEKCGIFKGKDGKIGISETQEVLQENDMLLGEYLNTIIPKKGEPYKEYRDENGKIVRARGRYTLREMYIEEFYNIWKRQAEKLGLSDVYVPKYKIRYFNGSLEGKRNSEKIASLKNRFGESHVKIEGNRVMTSEDVPLIELLAGKIWEEEDGIHHKQTEYSVLFWQRPLRSQKNLLGKCRFEHAYVKINGVKKEVGKSPCYLSHPDFEVYRALQFINNIEYGSESKKSCSRQLSDDEAEKLLAFLLEKKNPVKFSAIVKHLKLTDEKFNYDDDYSVPGCPTIASLKPLFDDNVWEENYHDIWHCFLFYKDSDKLYEKIVKSYSAKCSSVEEIDNIHLKEKYSNLSLKAINNIIEFLNKGYMLQTAVIMGGVKNAFGKEKWDDIKTNHEKIESHIVKMMKEKNREGELINKIKNYLYANSDSFGTDFQENDKRFRKLYHPSVELQANVGELKKKIPEIPNLRNPLVQRALTQTRVLTNKLIDKYGNFDIIRIEMARDLKSNSKQRREMTFKNRDNQKKNDEAREELIKFGYAYSRQNIRKYLLYKEIEEQGTIVVCPYTNKTIRISDLYGRNNLFQIEHIIPYSRSLNDSFANITLCESNFNREKGEKTPFEFYQQNSDPDLWGGAKSWREIEMRAFKLLPYNKAKRFCQKKAFDKDDFISRQLNDTRYISREIVGIMREVCSNVQVMPGMLTSELRHLWGLNNILQPVQNLDLEKGDVALESYPMQHWIIAKQNGTVVNIQRKENIKPVLPKGLVLLSGSISKKTFKSKYTDDIPTESTVNGPFWCQLSVHDDVELFPVFNKKPDHGERYFVLKGEVKNEKFTNTKLGKTVIADNCSDGKYWAVFSVIKKELLPSDERPRIKSNEYAIFGQVEKNRFSSYNYSCLTDHEEGEYWMVLTLDMQDVFVKRVLRDKPERLPEHILIRGTVNGDNVWISDSDPDHALMVPESAGKYWARFTKKESEPLFYQIYNKQPKAEKDEITVEGNIWLDKQSGELKYDLKKNREDQRHHAVDAITIAVSERGFYQKLSTYNAQNYEREKYGRGNKPVFEKPWDDFTQDTRKSVDKILVSYLKDNSVLEFARKTTYKNGKSYTTRSASLKGQLHKETVYGKRTAPDGRTAFHIRKSITELKKSKHVDKIVDEHIKKLIKKHLRDSLNIDTEKSYDIPENAFFKNGEYLVKLPNKNGDPVPIKKVRMREEIGNARQLKEDLNQFVNPRNNHHVLIYEDIHGNLKEDVVSFWDVSKRMNKGEDIFQLPEDGKKIITTLEINDMFLLGVPEGIDIQKSEPQELSPYLYRVQKLSKGDYSFRFHLASTLNNSREEVRIGSIKFWNSLKPIKYHG